MKPKVYIETTIISYLAARPNRDLIAARHQQVTHEWWQSARHNVCSRPKQFPRTFPKDALHVAVAVRSGINARCNYCLRSSNLPKPRTSQRATNTIEGQV